MSWAGTLIWSWILKAGSSTKQWNKQLQVKYSNCTSFRVINRETYLVFISSQGVPWNTFCGGDHSLAWISQTYTESCEYIFVCTKKSILNNIKSLSEYRKLFFLFFFHLAFLGDDVKKLPRIFAFCLPTTHTIPYKVAFHEWFFRPIFSSSNGQFIWYLNNNNI